MTWTKKEMGQQTLKLIPRNCTVNLGIGFPTLIADLIPQDANIIIHSENGVLGVAGAPLAQDVSPTLINAGKETISILKGASFFDSAMSFAMIRGGHIDVCVLGGMEVDAFGSLANWMIPGKKITGMGGAMDLVSGPKQVIIMMTHFNKSKHPKLVKNCSLPLTGVSVVDKVVTDMGIFAPNKQTGLFDLLALAPNIDINQLKMPGLIAT